MQNRTQPQSILCYGDSNTWGYVPTSFDSAQPISRYPRKERWTGRLQDLLGNDYYVVEEGLNSRTTNIDYSKQPDRNGKTYLPSCLYSHAPINLVVLALGGNDAKSYFNRAPQEIASGLCELIDIIQQSYYGPGMTQPPKILITTPPIPLPIAETHVDENGLKFFAGGINKMQKMPAIYEKLARDKNCDYLDLSNEVTPSAIDGVHYDSVMHERFAKLLCEKIKDIFVDRNIGHAQSCGI